jgi:hypothetical protein
LARQPQRFEGPDLEALLERIRHDLGDAARIVAANRVRRGGLGGFFAREHFEVIVERDDAAKTAVVVDLRDGPEPHATGANSILALAEAVNGTERVRERRRDRRARARGEATVDLVAAEAPISTESERFVEILDRIARDVDDTGLHERAPEDAVLPPEEFIASLRAPAPVEPGPLPAPPAPAKAPAPAVADRPALAQLPADLDGVRPFAPPRVRRSRDLDVIERPENALARLGVPPRFVPRGVVGLQLRGALIESLAQLPAADLLPDATGVVIAVVGLGATPVLLGRALAEERGLDPDNLVIATERQLGDGVPTWLQITDAATADERRRSWRRREHPTLVAVSIPTVGNGDVWARGMLDHLEPTQVWGIVSATWKLEDVQAWADRLGGLDVLALEHLADTVSPAAPMQLDIPIGRLDGRPATPVRWAEILVERLARR